MLYLYIIIDRPVGNNSDIPCTITQNVPKEMNTSKCPLWFKIASVLSLVVIVTVTIATVTVVLLNKKGVLYKL